MRVIGGVWRGAALEAPQGRITRPITDRAKESLFNILGVRFGTLGQLPSIEVLDLFAGSGALGLEALSRGAHACVFVERDAKALKTLRKNIARLRAHGLARVAAENSWSMREFPAVPCGFGLIFVDPPYSDARDAQRVRQMLERLGQRLATEGVLVFRHGGRREDHADEPPGLQLVDRREYGSMHVHFYERRETACADAQNRAPVLA